MPELHKGTSATKEFYDRIGWQRRDGELVDTSLFGWTDGPIRDVIESRRRERVLAAVGGPNRRIAELGCGGTPAAFLAQTAAHYTAVDFSPVGLAEAAAALKNANASFDTVEADITALPFNDGTFDVVYSAHAIYHIDTAEGQAAAFREAMRVVRPGGRAVFILANPFPLAFPLRAARRVLAMTPFVNTILNKLRPKPPLPYLPMPLGWMKKELQQWGDVTIAGHAVPSVAFDRKISETSALGRMMWRGVDRLEAGNTGIAARLGCCVLIAVQKKDLAQSG